MIYSRRRKNKSVKSRVTGNTSHVESTPENAESQKWEEFDVERFIQERDYTGAIAVLEFLHASKKKHTTFGSDLEPWIAYCAFHLGDYEKALEVSTRIEKRAESNQRQQQEWSLYRACCFYFLAMYQEAKEAAQKGTPSPLRNRLLFHVSDKLHDNAEVLKYHQDIQQTVEDQMSLAAMHFIRNHIAEATDIYRRILSDNHEYVALNMYIALCYYKLYDDTSENVQDIIDSYLRKDPLSPTALNLKACNQSKSFTGGVAIQQLQPILDIQNTTGQENYLIKHNMVVFNNGEGALQVLPEMIDMGIAEARLNLVIYYLLRDKCEEAYELMKDVEPGNVNEYILKAIVNVTLGQKIDSREHLRRAQKWFQLVGSSETDCDTIPGRQCMASCYFILRQFDNVVLYCKSIKDFYPNDETFHWNYGIALAALGKYKKAIQSLLTVNDTRLKQDFVYISWLARCYIMTGQPDHAWDLYLQMDSNDRMRDVVQLIADDCYRIGSFYYAAKAFDVLERLDPNPEYYEGKRGACIGTFQMVIAGNESKERLRDIIAFLRSSGHEESDYIVRVIEKWIAEMV